MPWEKYICEYICEYCVWQSLKVGGEAAVSDVCLRQQAREGAQEHISLLSLLLIILSFLSLLFIIITIIIFYSCKQERGDKNTYISLSLLVLSMIIDIIIATYDSNQLHKSVW